tara:strand:- start:72293 stop:72961 length:669 start_codon:yes stop_codon:yes gene_type:complete
VPSFAHLFETFVSSAPLFLKGALLTFELSLASVLIGLAIGLFFAFLSLSKLKTLNAISNFYITLVRGTPLIVQIFVLYFGLTDVVQISGFLAATLALAFHNGAYLSEIFRGAIQSIDRGQYEAAKSLGMTSYQTYARIILPQAFLRALPALGNQFIIALKDSSLAAFISMDELFNMATTQGANNFDQMTYLIIVAVYYLVMVMALSHLVNLVEVKLKRSGAT